MFPITVSKGVSISDPRLKGVAEEVFMTTQLAMDKAVAHHFDTEEYPLRPSRDSVSFEELFLAQFKQLQPFQQEAARSRVTRRIDAAVDLRRQYFGPLVQVDLRAATSVEDQVQRLLPQPEVRLRGADLLQDRLRRMRRAAGWGVRSGSASAVLAPFVVVEDGFWSHFDWEALKAPFEAIGKKYQQLGGASGFLGSPTGEEHWTPDGVGRYRHFQGGSIYWHPETGAHEVHGAILGLWSSLGWETGVLGFPLIDEQKTPDGVGRFSHFQRGSIYWTPETGAHEVHGAIREKWKSLGWEKSFLGYPLTGQLATPNGLGQYVHFQRGSIYWSPQTGAHEVHGAIRELWKSMGWEQSYLGFPLTDELSLPDGEGRCSSFQGGAICWEPEVGAYLADKKLSGKLGFRLLKLHCIDETNGAFGTEFGSDEISIGGSVIDTYGNVKKVDKVNLGKYNDGTWSDWPPFVFHELSVNQTDGIWPKTVLVTLVLVEVDSGGYTNFLNKLVAKLQPFVKDKLKKALVGVGGIEGGPLGVALGVIAGEIAAYVVDKVFAEIKSWWNDDLFKPLTVSVQIPGPAALFPGGAYETPDTYFWVKGHGGHYEYWGDFIVA